VSRFQTFQPLVNKYKKAIELATVLNDDELKALWKEHFARQITVSERTVMKTFQSAHQTVYLMTQCCTGLTCYVVRTVQPRQYRHDVLETTFSSTQMGTQARFPTTKEKGKRARQKQKQGRQSIAEAKNQVRPQI
jgi:hypothetical protein